MALKSTSRKAASPRKKRSPAKQSIPRTTASPDQGISAQGRSASIQARIPAKDDGSAKTARGLGNFINLAAWLNLLGGLFAIWVILAQGFTFTQAVSSIAALLLAGAFFWCARLLEQRRPQAFTTYTAIVAGLAVLSVVGHLFSRAPFAFREILPFILPAIIMFGLYRLNREGYFL